MGHQMSEDQPGNQNSNHKPQKSRVNSGSGYDNVTILLAKIGRGATRCPNSCIRKPIEKQPNDVRNGPIAI